MPITPCLVKINTPTEPYLFKINMPNAFKNTKYYDLVNNIILDPYLVKKYALEVLIPSNLKIVKIRFYIQHNTPWHHQHYSEKNIYNLDTYLEWLGMNLSIKTHNTIFKVLSKNTYKLMDLLIDAFIYIENTYYINNIVIPISKKIAINKIKRNKIYNLGLGLKLSVKAFKDDFN